MYYDKRILTTADPTKRIAITIVAKKRIFSPPRRAKWVILDSVPPSAPSIPAPDRCKTMTITSNNARIS